MIWRCKAQALTFFRPVFLTMSMTAFAKMQVCYEIMESIESARYCFEYVQGVSSRVETDRGLGPDQALNIAMGQSYCLFPEV